MVTPTAASTLDADDVFRDVVIDKRELCPGESVWVTVRAVDPDNPKTQVDVSVNGKSGATQRLRFDEALGVHVIHITADLGEQIVSKWETVEVVECENANYFIALDSMLDLYRPNTVDFQITNVPTRTSTSLASGSDVNPEFVYTWHFGDGTSEKTNYPFVTHDYSDVLDNDKVINQFKVFVTMLELPVGSFPLVDELNVHSETVFVSIVNNYALSKQNGLITPIVKRLERTDQDYAAFEVSNLENEAISIDTITYELIYCDLEKAPYLLEVSSELTIDPLGSYTVDTWQYADNEAVVLLEERGFNFNLDGSVVGSGSEVCDINMYHFGATESEQPSRFSIHWPVSTPDEVWSPVSHGYTESLLNTIVTEELVDDPTTITFEDIYRLEMEGRIVPSSVISLTDALSHDATVRDPSRRSRPAQSEVSDEECENDPIQLGCECDPDDTDGGLVCLPTNEWYVADTYVANAKKGDIILSSQCDMVGNLLQGLEQRYSHSGIMTKNFTEVRHVTASEGRYKAGAGSNGLNENSLKYGWPGAITQSIDEAITGQTMEDPDGVEYTISGFNPDPDPNCKEGDFAFPIVVKPSLEDESKNPEIRQILHRAADIASETHAHYRLYGYSNVEAAWEDVAPPEIEWAVSKKIDGEKKTVTSHGAHCAGFIFQVLKKAIRELGKEDSVRLEGELEEAEGKTRVKIDPNVTPDGLYIYEEWIRKAAADGMYSEIRNIAYDEGYKKATNGLWGISPTSITALTPLGLVAGNKILASVDAAANDTASQVVNCFIYDDCRNDADFYPYNNQESGPIRPVGDGVTVSPDNLRLWDSLAEGGLYGYSEKLVYRTGRYQPVYRWSNVQGASTLTIQVEKDGKPTKAEVIVNGSTDITKTTADGKEEVVFNGVHHGLVFVQAGAAVNNDDNKRLEGELRIRNFESDRTEIVNLNSEPYREIQITIDASVADERLRSDKGARYEHTESLEVNAKYTNQGYQTNSQQFAFGSPCYHSEHVSLNFEIETEWLEGGYVKVDGRVILGDDETSSILGIWGTASCRSNGDEYSFSVTVEKDGEVSLDEVEKLNSKGANATVRSITIKNLAQ